MVLETYENEIAHSRCPNRGSRVVRAGSGSLPDTGRAAQSSRSRAIAPARYHCLRPDRICAEAIPAARHSPRDSEIKGRTKETGRALADARSPGDPQREEDQAQSREFPGRKQRGESQTQSREDSRRKQRCETQGPSREALRRKKGFADRRACAGKCMGGCNFETRSCDH